MRTIIQHLSRIFCNFLTVCAILWGIHVIKREKDSVVTIICDGSFIYINEKRFVFCVNFVYMRMCICVWNSFCYSLYIIT